ncbi:MAG TPA: conjugative transposon protein TraK [Puia sp.]|nr:conjugative transposon protein TraK [Puia sp.]
MFQQFKNIDTAFKHIRLFSLAFLLANSVICLYALYKTSQVLKAGQNKIYVITNGKLMDALATDRREKLPVEIRDHVKMFHFYFYSLEPDNAVIKAHTTKALYLADATAKTEYDNLDETGYYSGVQSGNISQQVEEPDSIQVNIDQQPYYFRYYGKLKIIRPTTITTRSLVTEGFIRTTIASDNNPHGFLIERWKILDNHDINLQKR